MQVEYKKHALHLDIINDNAQYLIKIYKYKDVNHQKFIYYDKMVITHNEIYSSNGNQLKWVCCKQNILHKKHLEKIKKCIKYLKEYSDREIDGNKIILIFGKRRYMLEL